MKHIHILGICGTFMGSLAQLASALGYKVTGADANVYPPMSTQLEQAGIDIFEGWSLEQLDATPDVVIVGNAISRGNPVLEAVLERMLPYTSGPQWLADNVLQDRWVLAVAGTHGKTTTASMLAQILDDANMEPGFLIGGVPKNFGISARLGTSPFFVIEADEYDSAFCDKRSKFVHYRPHTLIMNNLEFDHADIFPDLAAIERQFHHLVRTVPSNGLIIYPESEPALKRVIDQGCWADNQLVGGDKNTEQSHDSEQRFKTAKGGAWRTDLVQADGSHFVVYFEGKKVGEVCWSLTGAHNVANGIAAIAAARHVGVEPHIACEGLSQFQNVKRRMDVVGRVGQVTIYDDFAHHPTAIATTLEGLRAKVGDAKIIAVIEPRSNTMKQGVLKNRLVASCEAADQILWYQSPQLGWQVCDITEGYAHHQVTFELPQLIASVLSSLKEETHVVIMSNGGFGGVHQKLLAALQAQGEQ